MNFFLNYIRKTEAIFHLIRNTIPCIKFSNALYLKYITKQAIQPLIYPSLNPLATGEKFSKQQLPDSLKARIGKGLKHREI